MPTVDSILNTSRYFHVTEGLVPDIMHDVLEGCLPYEAKQLIRYLTASNIISLEDLNHIIETLPRRINPLPGKPSFLMTIRQVWVLVVFMW